MKRVITLVLTLAIALSAFVCTVSATTEFPGASDLAIDFIAPSTVAPGETFKLEMVCWFTSDTDVVSEDAEISGSISPIIDPAYFDISTCTIKPGRNVEQKEISTCQYRPEFKEYEANFTVTGDVWEAGKKYEYSLILEVKLLDTVPLGTKLKIETVYSQMVTAMGATAGFTYDISKMNDEKGISIYSNEFVVHNAAKPLGGQVKTTNPAGLRLGFDIADLGETYSSIKIEINKEGGEKVTVPVTKFYNTERTQFTVCVKNIPEASKDVKFTAKAIITFADGTTTTSDAITLSYNDIATAIDANWNK